MKNYFIFIVFCICFKSFAQEVYQSDLYEFKIEGDTFELNHKYDIEELLYERRKSLCLLQAKGVIKKEEKFYYKLNSLPPEFFKSKLIKSEYKEELKDSLSITINISNFDPLDYNNFIFSSIYDNVKIQENKIEFKVPKVWASLTTLYAYPRNENIILSDDGISLSFSNQLRILIFQYDFSSLKYECNSFEFEIVDFDPCNLYLKYFDGDFIKIKNNKLYWKNMVFEKVR